jgi:glutathione S-transferase
MQLIGMLDSPYVRRVAISLQLLQLPFEHRSISVFRQFDQFKLINPLVKAPTLVCDDGEVLMESGMILQHAEALARPRTLMPTDIKRHQHTARLVGLALIACEKSVQIVYEHQLRPPEKLHEPWLHRVTGQLLAAWTELENDVARQPLALDKESIDQAGVSVAVAWHFAQQMIPRVVLSTAFPALAAVSMSAEQLPEFRAAPHGSGTYAP